MTGADTVAGISATLTSSIARRASDTAYGAPSWRAGTFGVNCYASPHACLATAESPSEKRDTQRRR